MLARSDEVVALLDQGDEVEAVRRRRRQDAQGHVGGALGDRPRRGIVGHHLVVVAGDAQRVDAAAGEQPVEPDARARATVAVHEARAGRDGAGQVLEPAGVAGRDDEALLPVRERDEHERAAGEQRPRVRAVEVAGLGVEEVAAGHVAERRDAGR